MEDKIRELQELKRMREELEGEITALEDAVKADERGISYHIKDGTLTVEGG